MAKIRPDSRLYAIRQIISTECGVDVCLNRLHFKRAVRKIAGITYYCLKNRNTKIKYFIYIRQNTDLTLVCTRYDR